MERHTSGTNYYMTLQAPGGHRNGTPEHKPYTRECRWDSPPDPRDVWAWQTVADLQARLRGEPPPGPVGEPWNRDRCHACLYTITCRCGVT